jgi:hypothetical protein
VGQVEIRALNRKTGHDMATTLQMPEKFRAEGGFVEVDGCMPVTHSQHGRDLGHHHVAPASRPSLPRSDTEVPIEFNRFTVLRTSGTGVLWRYFREAREEILAQINSQTRSEK